MWNKLYQYIVNKLRFARYAFSSKPKLYTFGTIIDATYTNWKHDINPHIWIQYSGPKYTHAINLNYLNYSDKAWFGRLIYSIIRGKQKIDPLTFYKMLKIQRMSVVKTAYRVYFTGMLKGKMISSGINQHLHSMIYTRHKDQFIHALNKTIAPKEIASTSLVEVAYSPTELRDRIISAQNSTSITKQRVSPRTPNTGAFGVAPWRR